MPRPSTAEPGRERRRIRSMPRSRRGKRPRGHRSCLAASRFGLVFLLAWQFLPPALGVPSYIIPTVTDLVHEFARMVSAREPCRACALHGDHCHCGLRGRKPARRGHGLHPRHVGTDREGALALHTRPADRAQGGVRAAVHHVARLQCRGRSSSSPSWWCSFRSW